ncbi:hypothetical protein X953_19735 [Virgibacillus sp. SK37]|nr:hypothetical protein X953_19735 [Virgibacillus sp. SK37]
MPIIINTLIDMKELGVIVGIQKMLCSKRD